MTDLDICQKGMRNVAVTSSTNTLQVCSRHATARTKRFQFSCTLELNLTYVELVPCQLLKLKALTVI